MAATGHYRDWRQRLRARRASSAHAICATARRCICIFVGPGRYDWGFIDEVDGRDARARLEPIVDLCHFGVPDWLGNFQNPRVRRSARRIRRRVRRRYPWVRFYTPVNEMYVCAKLSALDGVWNEQLRTSAPSSTAVRHLARANVADDAGDPRERPDAVFVNSESGEFYQPCCPDPEIRAHRRVRERAALPAARSALRAPRRRRHADLSARARHAGRGIRLVHGAGRRRAARSSASIITNGTRS